MGIITLTSDLGLRDHYVAAVKASILSQAPQASIVDISHEVRSFDLHAASFLLRNVWQHFPIGTVHIIGVNPELTARTPHVAIHYMGHYFIGADNGIFALIFEQEPEEIIEITLPQGDDWTFPMKGVFAMAASHLSRGGSIEFLGRRTHSFNQAMLPAPSLEGDLLKGHVEYIDHYGNVYCNISKTLFEQVRRKRRFNILYKRVGFAISKISNYFTDVVEGERLAMWSTGGRLMIAINGGTTNHGGGAAGLFGLEVDDLIRIEFYGDANSEDDFPD
ncbi:MAG: S-adenosyl-l-methionine hydroxide adenosyltransferase family protein [Flavobacteriales bacterium]